MSRADRSLAFEISWTSSALRTMSSGVPVRPTASTGVPFPTGMLP
jgi:hypothetical protein